MRSHTRKCGCYSCLPATAKRALGKPTCEADAFVRHLKPITKDTRVVLVATVQDGKVLSVRAERWMR